MNAHADIVCRRAIWCLLAHLLVAGCATWQVPTDASEAELSARATVGSAPGVRVSATVLGSQDSLRMLGADVNSNGVQPVWIEVANRTTQPLWLLRSGADPDYFSALEVAWSAHVAFGGETNLRIDEHFDRLAFRNPIPPGEDRRGLLFTNPQPVTKLLNIDLLGDKVLIPLTLLVPVPGEFADSYQQHVHPYSEAELTRCEDEAALRLAIEGLPPFAAASGGETSQPLNVVLVGRLEDIGAAMSRRGYRRESPLPHAGQQLFGRAPDFVVRKRAQAGAPANWLRLWRAPIAYGDQLVFVAQAGRPVGGRFAGDAGRDRLQLDVDEVRNALVQDFFYSGGLEMFGFAAGVGAAPAQADATAEQRGYRTDGLRAVLFFVSRPLTIAEVNVLEWESLAKPAAE